MNIILKAYYHFFFKSYYYHHLVATDKKRALELKWKSYFDQPIDWYNPQTMNEKVQWLELYTDTSLWSKYADKYEVRGYLIELGFGKYLTKLYGVWDNVEDIDFNILPNQFVIKCTHDYRSAFIVKDKNQTNIKDVVKQLRKHLNVIYGYDGCEPHYTLIKPRIIAEELLLQGEGQSLIDYKFCCIGGQPQYCLVCYDRPRSNERGSAIKDVYKLSPWSPYPDVMVESHANHSYKNIIPEPQNYYEMLEIAKKLSEGFPLVHIDLYNVKGRIVFGEMTFTRDGGRITYLTDKFQKEMGRLIMLPVKK